MWLTLNNWPDGLTRVVFCDVGQGDAILITRGNTQMLIDGGPDDKVLMCLANHLPWWDRRIEIVAATHAHADHITGLTQVLQQYQVGSILMTDQTENSDEYQALVTQIRAEERVMIISPETGKKLVLGPQTVAEIVWPKEPQDLLFLDSEHITETQLSASLKENKGESENINDGSIVLYLTIGDIVVLLTGDLEEIGEEALLTSALTKDINVLKVGHHGSKTSSSMAFISQVQPELSVISCGLNNRYDHPSPEVVSRLEEAGSRVLRTDQVGEITLISDGREYWLTF